VSVIVSDPAGRADTAHTTITVLNAPPVISDVLPPTQQAIGVPASIHVAFSDSGARDTHVVTVRWGDGTSDSKAADTIRWHGDSLIHVYATVGRYQPRVIVRDDDGGVDSATAGYPVIVFDPSERQLIGGYEASDLGTLGGNSTAPFDLNNVGQIVGSSLTASGEQHAFLWDDGVMHDLDVGDGSWSRARRINDAGFIAGEKVRLGVGYDGDSRPVIWRNGVATPLSGIPYSAEAVAVNASGDVAWRGYGHESVYGFLSRNDALQQLHDGSRTDEFRPTDMNDQGQIVGLLPTQFRGGDRIFHAALWNADSVRDLGALGPLECTNFGSGDCSSALAMHINAAGQIVGTSTDSAGANHFVIWENGGIHDLGLAPTVAGLYEPAFSARAFINDRGQVAASAGGQGFFWNGGSLESIGSLGGLVAVAGINEDGKVIGTVLTPSGDQHAFVWSQSRGMVDLGTGPHGFGRAWVVGINQRGDILGLTGPCEHRYNQTCGYPLDTRAILWRNTEAR
jgi:probable HAF family extracellular repeat protein